MELGISFFDSWDDWDDDWSDVGNSGSGGNQPQDPPNDGWGRRAPAGGGNYSTSSKNTNEDPDVYVIRSINEIPLRGRSAFSKIFSGIPVSANNQINLSLQQSGNVGHGGGVVNAIIYGKIENQALGPGMKIKVLGKNKRGMLIIQKMWDVDSGGMPIRINHFWKDPLDKGGGTAAPVVTGAIILILLLAAALAILLKSGIDPGTLRMIKLVAAIVAILVFIKVFQINIFNNPLVQKILLFVVLAAIALFVPGGDSVMIAAIMLYGMYLLIKTII